MAAGGGERNGIEGIVVGILIGSPDGKFGNGGSCVAGLGRDGWLFGKFGNVGCGSVGRGGKGGSCDVAGLGKVGAVFVCKRYCAPLRPHGCLRSTRE